MNTFSTILLYGVPASLLLSAVIFAMGWVNPRLMLRSYPKDVQAAVPPQTDQEKRQTLKSSAGNAKFYQADLRGSCFSKATMSWCDFREASLEGADFSQALLHSARFGDAKLFSADLRESNLLGAREMTSEQLCQARTSEGTTLPSGRRGVYLKGSGTERPGLR